MSEAVNQAGRYLDIMNELAEFLRDRLTMVEAFASLETDTDRILADVDSKRQIIDLHAQQHVCPIPGNSPEYSYVTPVCWTLRLLAMPYADHDNYRDEWRV